MLLIVLSDCFSFQHHSAVDEPCYVLVVSTRGNPSRQISRYCKVKAVFNNSRRAVDTGASPPRARYCCIICARARSNRGPRREKAARVGGYRYDWSIDTGRGHGAVRWDSTPQQHSFSARAGWLACARIGFPVRVSFWFSELVLEACLAPVPLRSAAPSSLRRVFFLTMACFLVCCRRGLYAVYIRAPGLM